MRARRPGPSSGCRCLARRLGLAGSAVLVFVAAGEIVAGTPVAWCGPGGGAARGGDRRPAPGRAGRHRGRAGQPSSADQALEIMRRSDAGPLGRGHAGPGAAGPGERAGLAAARLAGGGGASGLVLAAVTSRVAVVLATGSPSARPSGFGALVAGRTSAAVPGGQRGGAAGRGGRGRPGPGRGWRPRPGALRPRWRACSRPPVVRWAARRRLGGMTGDVFGAIVELSTATVLLVLVLGR